MLSAGLERHREEVLAAIQEVCAPEGILLRNDPAVREREGLPREVALATGTVPEDVEVREGKVRYLVSPWTGQKTGAFLDQRPARLRAGALMPDGGRALDCFSYHGSFALHLAARAGEVVALDASAEALERGRRNAALNGLGNIRWEVADAFEWLRAREREGAAFDMIVLDPPAFAKSRSAVGQALRGYGEINLRAMRLLSASGVLLTASCSHHVDREKFLGVLAQAAADSGRRLRLEELPVQGVDHPAILTIPETSYLKAAILRAV
jgi:23S rRNA (cytosine1962-C5)-methyltransferase